jgi:hypothetical protein
MQESEAEQEIKRENRRNQHRRTDPQGTVQEEKTHGQETHSRFLRKKEKRNLFGIHGQEITLQVPPQATTSRWTTDPAAPHNAASTLPKRPSTRTRAQKSQAPTPAFPHKNRAGSGPAPERLATKGKKNLDIPQS